MLICRLCGAGDSARCIEDTRRRMIEKQLCFDCNHFDRWFEEAEGSKHHFIIGGGCYIVFPDADGKYEMIGFNGRRFDIQPLDGRPAIVTHNLWYQGRLPDHFRKDHHDTAKFIMDGSERVAS